MTNEPVPYADGEAFESIDLPYQLDVARLRITALETENAALREALEEWLEENITEADEGQDGIIVKPYYYCDFCDTVSAPSRLEVQHFPTCFGDTVLRALSRLSSTGGA